jgi:hypothetical protein
LAVHSNYIIWPIYIWWRKSCFIVWKQLQEFHQIMCHSKYYTTCQTYFLKRGFVLMVTLGVFLNVFETQDPGIHDTLTHDLLYNRKSLIILLRKLSTCFYSKLSLNCITTIDNLYINAILHARIWSDTAFPIHVSMKTLLKNVKRSNLTHLELNL